MLALIKFERWNRLSGADREALLLTGAYLVRRPFMHPISNVDHCQESLFSGLSVLFSSFQQPDQADTAISSSFHLAAKGLDAKRAGIFLIRYKPEGIHLETLCSVGLAQQEIHAIEFGQGPEEDTRLTRVCWAIKSQTDVKAGDQILDSLQHLSSSLDAVCLPTVDPILKVPSAVLYFEREAGASAESKRLAKEWADVYSLALGQIIRVGFAQKDTEYGPESARDSENSSENKPRLIGDSIQTQVLRSELHDIHISAASAPDPDPILILGERGTGKDLVARYIYSYSARRNAPYVAVNCAEITDEMATARFFGHKRGAFTGSVASEPGLFRAADGGVLFLDEIGDLSLRAQATLLRVLENRTLVPVGETKEVRVNVQVILGTNCNPEKAVAEGRMRPDLLDRFRTNQICLAPLRERPWDIPALVRHFIAYHEDRTRKKTLGLAPDVLKTMVGYSWSGNVRELARVCSLLITHAKPGMLIDNALFARLFPHVAKERRNPAAGALLDGDLNMKNALETFGRELILARLRQHNWDVKLTRESLGLPKTTFHRYTRALGISGSMREALACTG
jgi:DNA-binding NtrC family response regulator